MNAAVAGVQTIAVWPDPPSRKQYAAPRLDQLNTRGPGGPDADDRSAANLHVDRREHVVTVKYPRPRNDEMIHCSPVDRNFSASTSSHLRWCEVVGATDVREEPTMAATVTGPNHRRVTGESSR